MNDNPDPPAEAPGLPADDQGQAPQRPAKKRKPPQGAQGADRSGDDQPQPWHQSPVAFAVALIVVVAALIAWFATSGDDDAEPAPVTVDGVEVAETGFAEAVGAPLARFPDPGEPDTALGAAAPVIVAETYAGERLELGGDGIARVIGFFAHWCPHCQAELPRVVEWQRDIAVPAGVQVVAVSTAVDADRGNYPPSAWFADEGYEGILVRDSAEFALAIGYGLTGFPYWVVVGADGSLVARTTGSIDTEAYETMLGLAAASVEADSLPAAPTTRPDDGLMLLEEE